MSAPRNTNHHSARKSAKKKRSLKRSEARCEAQHAALHERGIVVDMSKSELDGIFSGLSLGELENPQEALGQVYALAIDSVANTLVNGLDQVCAQMAESADDALSTDNPLSAWILQMIPRDPAKIAAFKENLTVQIDAMKSRIQTSMVQGMAANSDLERMTAVGRQTGDMVRQTLSDASGRSVMVPGMGRHISGARLEEIYRMIQRPMPADGVERFNVTALPGAYRFRVGAPQVVLPEREARAEDASALADGPEVSESENLSIQTGDNVSDLSHEGGDAGSRHEAEWVGGVNSGIQAVTSDMMHAVSEVSGMLQNVALEMAHVMVDAYQKERAFQPLSETLKSDPRLDEDLSEFLDALEDEESCLDASEVTNDELASALDVLLASLDLED